MRRLLALAALFALPAAGLACGDDGGGGGTTDEATDESTDEETISLADWISQADEVCAGNDAEIDAIEEPPFDPNQDLDDDQLQEVADYLSDIATIEQETVDSLEALPPPDESADEVTAVLASVQNAVDDTNEAATAAGAGDQDEAEGFLESAGQQFDEASEMAQDLGLQGCGVSEEGNTGDTGDSGRSGRRPGA